MKIAVIPGDGTGPEVIAEAIKVLAAVAKLEGFSYELNQYDFGGDRYLKTGEVLPEGAVRELEAYDAILLGAVGHPDVAPGILEKGLLLELRFQLDQYINLRPVKLFPGVETPLAGKGPSAESSRRRSSSGLMRPPRARRPACAARGRAGSSPPRVGRARSGPSSPGSR